MLAIDEINCYKNISCVPFCSFIALSEALLVCKIGEMLVMTSLYERPLSVQTLGKGEGRLNVT